MIVNRARVRRQAHKWRASEIGVFHADYFEVRTAKNVQHWQVQNQTVCGRNVHSYFVASLLTFTHFQIQIRLKNISLSNLHQNVLSISENLF